MLEWIESVDWAALGHATIGRRCALAAAPAALRRPEGRTDALHELFFTIVDQSTRYSATAPAVPFLVELASAPDTHERLGSQPAALAG